jgi:hypothetical protein
LNAAGVDPLEERVCPAAEAARATPRLAKAKAS